MIRKNILSATLCLYGYILGNKVKKEYFGFSNVIGIDILVNNEIIIEIKAVECLYSVHEAQII